MAISSEDIRLWLRDHPEKNVLLDDVEFDTPEIEAAIKFTVADFNETPPFTAYAAETFPFVAMLANGVAWWLYRGESVRQTRNHLPYNTGGVQVDDQNKGPEYAQLASLFQDKYETAKRQIKNHINLEQGWGNVLSEYAVWRYY